jgi:2OG-Fe(II) oxygenase superfamily
MSSDLPFGSSSTELESALTGQYTEQQTMSSPSVPSLKRKRSMSPDRSCESKKICNECVTCEPDVSSIRHANNNKLPNSELPDSPIHVTRNLEMSSDKSPSPVLPSSPPLPDIFSSPNPKDEEAYNCLVIPPKHAVLGVSTTEELTQKQNLFKTAIPQVNASPQVKTALQAKPPQPKKLENSSHLPQPMGQPLVWAASRQALCETLPYFNSWQGGTYCHDGFARGFLFDGDTVEREYLDENVIIARCGGGRVRGGDGNMSFGKDQSADKSQVQSLRRSMANEQAVVIILGDKYQLATCRLDRMYSVLGWFKVTDIWPEKLDGKKIIRYRFEKLNRHEQSWWAPRNGKKTIELDSLSLPNTKTCVYCKEKSQEIFKSGWMCLNENCTRFWRYSTGRVPKGKLQYRQEFLQKYTKWKYEAEPEPIRPLRPKMLSNLAMFKRFTKGIVCDNCNACIVRTFMSGEAWKCETPGCDFKLFIEPTVIPISALLDNHHPVSNNSLPWNRDRVLSQHIKVSEYFDGGYRMLRYDFEGADSFVIHLTGNQNPRDIADRYFEGIQETASTLPLERRPLEHSPNRGPTRCSQYTLNLGMPYKFVASAESMSFGDAPEVLDKIRAILNYYSQKAVGDSYHPANEALLLGYLEGGRIGYHDDGEFGLGPTISTMSFGCAANMRLRMKAKHYYGISKAGVLQDCKPMLGGDTYDERLKAYDTLKETDPNDKKAYDTKKREIVKELGLKQKKTAPPAVLDLHVSHGDIVIMHGKALQQYFEVSLT